MIRNLLQRSFQSRSPISAAEQPDRLESEHIVPIACGHAGVPEAADSLAYDPVQCLLALGTSDGRVKVVGQEGVEIIVTSISASPTKHLQFLCGYGAILRINMDGDVQIYGLNQVGMLDSLPADEETGGVTAAVAMTGEPYVLLGCGDGSVRIAVLLNEEGLMPGPVSPVARLELRPYTISAEQLAAGGGGAVTDMALHVSGRTPHELLLLLLTHEDGSASVWDTRRQQLLAVLGRSGSSEAAYPALCCCWLGGPGSFATGHTNGDVQLWSVPSQAVDGGGEESDVTQRAPVAVHKVTLQVCRGCQDPQPVRRLSYLGALSAPGCEALLALGGQQNDTPDKLTLLPLPTQDPNAESQPHELPWFNTVQGFALLPAPGAAAAAGHETIGILQLAQGGRLMVHDLRSGVPMPFNLPFQELSPVSKAVFSGAAPAADGTTLQNHAATMIAMQAAKVVAPKATDGSWKYILSGGVPPPLPSTLEQQLPSAVLVTGHRDGRCRVWNTTSEVPRLLSTVPYDAGGQTGRLRTVTAVQVCADSGLLVVGHQQGSICVYQFSSAPHEVSQADLIRDQAPSFTATPQPPGWQCVLHSTLNAADITSLAVLPAQCLLAAGDAAGGVVVIDLSQPSALWGGTVGDSSIAGLAIAMVKPAVSTRRASFGLGSLLKPRLVVVAVSGEGGAAIFDARTGEGGGSGSGSGSQWVVPKHASEAVAVALLNGLGAPLTPQHAPVDLQWATNSNSNSNSNSHTHADATSPRHGCHYSDTAQVAVSGPPSPPVDAATNSSTCQHATSQDAAQCQPPSPLGQSQCPKEGSAADCALEQTPPAVPYDPHQHQHGVLDGLQAASPLTPLSSFRDSECPEAVGEASDNHAYLSDSDSGSGSEVNGALASAAAAMDAPEHSQKKDKRRKGFMRIAARPPRAEQPAEHLEQEKLENADEGTADVAMPGQGEVLPLSPVSTPLSPDEQGAQARLSRFRRSSVDNDSEYSPSVSTSFSSIPPLPTLRKSQTGASRSSFSSTQYASYPGSPAQSSISESTTAHYTDAATAFSLADAKATSAAAASPIAELVLVATRQFLRLSSLDAIRNGERAPLRKAVMAEGLVHAAAFLTSDGPGVAALTYSGNLLVYALPSLEPISATPLQMALGFPFGQDPTTDQVALSAVVAMAQDGHTLLIGPIGETVRINLAGDAQRIAGAQTVFDWDLAKAAAAAVEASSLIPKQRKALRSNNRVPDALGGPSPTASGSTQAISEASTGTGTSGNHNQGADPGRMSSLRSPAGTKLSLSTFLSSVKDVTTKVITETEKGVHSLARDLEQKVGTSFKKLHEAPHLPSVSHVFEGLVPNSSASKQSEPHDEFPAGDSNISNRGESSRMPTEEEKSRAALFAGACRVAGSSGKPVARSAADIRSAYGRPGHSDIHGQANENLKALGERGDKLRGLAERTEKMESDAMDFASMAKELAARERDKKWWQM